MYYNNSGGACFFFDINVKGGESVVISGCDFKDATGKLQWFPSMPKGDNVGKCFTGSIFFSLMEILEYVSMEKQEQSKIGRSSDSDRWITNPEFLMVVRSECRQEELAEMEDRSRALDLSIGSGHCWI
jgi:hypothetical protein